jgi:hypothetical protein
MAGLLDFIGTPEGQGLLSAAFGGLAGARRGQPLNSLGRAGLAGLSGYADASDRQTQTDQLAKRNQLFELQLRAAQAAESDRAIARARELSGQQALIEQLTPVSAINANDASGVTGPRPEALSAVGRTPTFDARSLIARGVPVDTVKSIAESPNWGRAKLGPDLVYRDANGMEVTQQRTELGDNVGVPMRRYHAPVGVNQGNRHTFVDPDTQQPMSSLPIYQSADSVASTSQARDRLNFDKDQARTSITTIETPDGLVAVPTHADPSQPVMVRPMLGADGKPVAGKGGALSEAQGNAVAFGIRADNALKNLDKLNTISNGDYWKAQLPWGTGNFAMTPNGQQAMNAEKQFLAAILRKESGAAIGQGEYATYGDQYFPRPGDSPEKLEQKRTNRELAIKGLHFQAGPVGSRGIYTALEQQAAEDDARAKAQAVTPPPTPGRVRFLGFDDQTMPALR